MSALDLDFDNPSKDVPCGRCGGPTIPPYTDTNGERYEGYYCDADGVLTFSDDTQKKVKYRVTFSTTIGLTVDTDATDENEAAEKAWGLAEEYLQTVGGNYRDVRAETTLDGIGHDTVELVDD